MSTGHGFAIIGTGMIAAMHADAIATLPGARLVAVTDIDAGLAVAFAAARGCEAEPDLDALLARADVDVVCVCVPSGLHAEIGIRAAKAGKHLVVEKPIDVTLAAADRLIEAARAAGVALTVISQHRFDPGLIELKRLLGDGALGRLVLGEASTKWYRSQAYYDSAGWRGTWAMDGGSLLNQGIHYVDLLRWCMGPVAEVTAVCATQAHQIEVEDTALAIVRFSSGAVGTILSSTAAFPGFPQRLEITGTEGTVIIEDGWIVRRAFGAGARAGGDGGPEPAPGWGRRPRLRPGCARRHQPRRADRRPAGGDRRGTRARGRWRGRPRRARDRLRRVRVGPHRPDRHPGLLMTVTLSGFADEISPEPHEQLAMLAAESITHLELRSAWSVNVADFTGEQLAGFRVDAGRRRGAGLRDRVADREDPGRRAARSRARPDAPHRRHGPRARHHDRPRVLVLHPGRRAAGAAPRAGHRPDGGPRRDRRRARPDPGPREREGDLRRYRRPVP